MTGAGPDADAAAAALRRRAGPLLRLFPASDDAAAGGSGAPSRRAAHAVLTPALQRAYLASHACRDGDDGDGDRAAVLARYDLLAAAPLLVVN